MLTVVVAKSIKCLGFHRIFSHVSTQIITRHQQFKSPIVQIRVLGLRKLSRKSEAISQRLSLDTCLMGCFPFPKFLVRNC